MKQKPETGPDSGPLSELAVAVVGNFNPADSGVIYQAEVLVENFRAEGARVLPVTYQQNRYLRPLATLWELLRHHRRYQVLCCQAYSNRNWANGLVSVLVGKLLRKPITMVYRGGGFREFAARTPWIVIPFLRRVDVLVVPSGFLLEEFRKHGLEARIIPNLIELEGWPRRRRERLEPHLLWVRHLRTGYNPWMAVEVLRRVQTRYPGATLSLAGDGHLEEEMRARIAAEGIQGVKMLGHLPLSELQAHYDRCDIFLNTTNYDNQPRSVLEAMACGLPVISTDVGGLPFLIEDRRNGLLVPPEDPEPMTRAVIELLDSPALARELAEGAEATVRSFSWTVSRLKWFEVFAEVGFASEPEASVDPAG